MARGKTTANAANAQAPAALAIIEPPAELVSMVYRWILDGQAEHDIREAIATKWPQAQAQPLILAAVKRFSEAGQFESQIMLGWCAEAYRDLYRVAREAGDIPSALRAVKQLSQLAGGR